MLRFIIRLCCFVSLILLVMLVGILLPVTPRASTAHLSAKIDKDMLLRSSSSPRIILVGGSNLSMSINSRLLLDSLQRFPINTGLSASLGLLYMMDSSLPYVRSGDIVIVSPEYSQFYDGLEIGTEDLARVILDHAPASIFRLRREQFFNCLKYIPRYSLSKFKLTDYLLKSDTLEVYQRKSFNEYGDMNKHWSLERKAFAPLEDLPRVAFDESAVANLDAYRRRVEQKGARLYVTFPAVDEQSFQMQEAAISAVRSTLVSYGFEILGDPGRYKMPIDYMFDTPYHLTQPGVDYRTQLLIQDLKPRIVDRVEHSRIYPTGHHRD